MFYVFLGDPHFIFLNAFKTILYIINFLLLIKETVFRSLECLYYWVNKLTNLLNNAIQRTLYK